MLRASSASLLDQNTNDRTMYAAINQGIRAAPPSTEWLAYINGDDVPFPMALTRLASVGAQTNSDVVYGDAVFFRIQRSCLSLTFEAAFGNAPRVLASVVLPFTQPAAIFRHSLWSRLGGFDETMSIAGDLDFYVRAFRSGAKFTHVPGVAVGFRKTGNSLGDRNVAHGSSERALIGSRFPSQPTTFMILDRLRRRLDSEALSWRQGEQVDQQMRALLHSELTAQTGSALT